MTTTREIIREYRRRLGHLEVQRAQQGFSVDPKIVMEIDDIYRELGKLMIHTIVVKEETPPFFSGLIVLVGPGQMGKQSSDQSAIDAIKYHYKKLKYCWMIGSSGEHGSESAINEIQAEYANSEIIFSANYVDDPRSVHQTYHIAQQLYVQELPKVGLQEQQVIADITGATKLMSFGLLRACGTSRPMQYMVRQPQGPSLPMMLRYSLGEDETE